MAFRAEMSTEGRARFSVAGMPMEYNRRAMPLWGSRKRLRIRTRIGRAK